MLRFCPHPVLVLDSEFLNVTQHHRDVESTGVVVPTQFNATVKVAGPVLVAIFLFNIPNEVICMLFSDIFYSKSLTINVVTIGRILCFHRPGVFAHL